MDWKAIAALVAIIALTNGGFIWAVKCLLANNSKKLAEDIKKITDANGKQDERLEDLKNDFSRLKEKLPEKYVRREDWIISFGRIQQKIDGIWEFIHKTIESQKLSGGK